VGKECEGVKGVKGGKRGKRGERGGKEGGVCGKRGSMKRRGCFWIKEVFIGVYGWCVF
jgi:hypothetical protein